MNKKLQKAIAIINDEICNHKEGVRLYWEEVVSDLTDSRCFSECFYSIKNMCERKRGICERRKWWEK